MSARSGGDAADGALDLGASADGPGAADDRPATPRSRAWLWALLAPVAAGVLVGAAWRLLAPVVRVQAAVSGKVLLVNAPSDPELFAAQDGTLVLLGAAAGIVTGLVVVVRARRRPATTTLLAVLGSVLGSSLAVGLGHVLGPGSLASQGFRASAAAADQPALTSPLSLHAPGAVLVWPLLALVVAALGHAVVASRLGRRARRLEEVSAEETAATGEPGPGA